MLIPAGAVHSPKALPTLNYDHIGVYMRALERLHDPRARAILRQIAQGPADLAREKRAARREGIPLERRLLQQPVPPLNENAAPLYHEFVVLERSHPLHLPEYANGMSTRYAYTPEQLDTVRRILHDRPDVMGLVHRIGDRRRCVFQHDWNKDSSIFGPDIFVIRSVERLLRTESYLLSRQGRYDEAIADEVRAFRVAEHAASDRLLISYMVGVACESIAVVGMRDIVTLAGPNAPGVDARAAHAIRWEHSKFSLRSSLRGETTFDVSGLELLRQQGPRGLAEQINMGIKPFSGERLKDLTPAEREFFDHLLDAEEARVIHG
ncbi:MAG: hypothetical protein M3Y56_04550, partial [Armatimonadota bacterium]|nr:hypothetical protein [Armatimonadota bacterium]